MTAGDVTVDASVFVAAQRLDEPHRPECETVIQALISDGVPMHQPSLTLVEVSAALARRTLDTTFAREGIAVISGIPGVVFHDLDLSAARAAAEVAADAVLRGADAVYVQVARDQGTTLVTLDQELLARSPDDVDAITPRMWLDRQPGPRATETSEESAGQQSGDRADRPSEVQAGNAGEVAPGDERHA